MLVMPAGLLAGPGSTTGNVLKLSLSPRAAGMGEAFTAVPGGLDSLSFNPAALTSLRGHEFKAMHANLIVGLRQQEFAYGLPTSWGAFAGEFMSFGSEPLDAFDANDNPIGSVRASDRLFRLAYARRLSGNVSAGAGIAFLRESLAGVAANTAFADLGVRAHWLEERLSLGFSYRNLGPGLKFDTDFDPLPRTAALGAAWEQRVGSFNRLLGVLDFLSPNDRPPQTHIGAELWFYDILALRGGYLTELDIGSGIRFGAGVRWKGIGFDYALATLGDLGDTHRLGLSYRFGKKKAARVARTPAAPPLQRLSRGSGVRRPSGVDAESEVITREASLPVAETPAEPEVITGAASLPVAETQIEAPALDLPVAQTPVPSSQQAVLRNIEVLPDQAILHLRGQAEFRTSYFHRPPRAVIDLFDTRHESSVYYQEGSGRYLRRIRSGPYQKTPVPVTRVVLDLNEPAAHRIKRENNRLTVMLAKRPSFSGAALDAAASDMRDSLRESEAPLSPARPAVLKRIQIEPDQAILHLSAQVELLSFFLYEPFRVVVDLIHTQKDISVKQQAGSGRYLSRVRPKQYQEEPFPVTRVVLDLKKSAAYRTKWDKNTLRITLMERGGALENDP